MKGCVRVNSMVEFERVRITAVVDYQVYKE